MLEELILLLIVLFLEVKTYVITDIFIDIVVYSNYYNYYYYYFTISIIYNVKILIDYTTKIRNYIMIINIIVLLILKIFFSNAVIERKFSFLSQDSYDFFNDVFIR